MSLFNLNRPVTYFYSVEVSGVHYSEKGPKADAAREKAKADRKRVWAWRCENGRRENQYGSRAAAEAQLPVFKQAFPDVEFHVAQGSPL